MDVDSPDNLSDKASPQKSPFQQFCLNSLSPINPFSPPQFAQPMDISPNTSPFNPNLASASQSAAAPILPPRVSDFGVMKTITCKCRKTQCLKLYCDCFARQEVCGGCGCTDCLNTYAADSIRTQAIQETTDRNPDAFKPSSESIKKGCSCKKSGCRKKYCECYQVGLACTSICKCQSCLNR